MKKILATTALLLALNGCAVYKAAQNDGASVEEIHNCKNKLCFLSLNTETLSTKNQDGDVIETYRVKRKKGGSTYVRAFAHGALDLFTLGAWEIIGTPIEGHLSSENFIVFRVTYDGDENIKKVEVQGN